MESWFGRTHRHGFLAWKDLLAWFLPLEGSIGVKRPQACCIAGRPGTQVQDLTWTTHLAVAKGLDQWSQIGIAQSDIATYYDRIRLGRVVAWLEQRGLAPSGSRRF